MTDFWIAFALIVGTITAAAWITTCIETRATDDALIQRALEED